MGWFKPNVERMEAKKDVKGLIKALNDKDFVVRRKAAKALGGVGDERAVESLVHALKDKDSDVRMHAAFALGNIGDVRAVEPLIHALHDQSFSDFHSFIVWEKATEALGKIGDERAVQPLIEALRYESMFGGIDLATNTRRKAAEALEKIGSARAAAPLIQALRDRDFDVRKRAKEALVRIGKSGEGALVQGLKDEDSAVRMEVANILEQLGWGPSDDAEKAYYLIAKRKWNDVLKLGERATQPLIQALLKDETNRPIAVELLVRIGKPAVGPLIQALERKDWAMRQGAAEALGKIGDIRAIGPLIESLKMWTPESPWQLPIVDTEAHARISWALSRFGEYAVEPLIQALKDNDHDVREKAAYALGEIGDERAVKPLTELLKDVYAQKAAEESLKKIKARRS